MTERKSNNMELEQKILLSLLDSISKDLSPSGNPIYLSWEVFISPSAGGCC